MGYIDNLLVKKTLQDIKMEAEKMQITWNDYQNNASDLIRLLWNDRDFSDVTLATVDDQQIKAHKVVLSSCSSFFKNLILKNDHPNPLIYLKHIKYNELERIMEYMYLGQCEIRQEELTTFFQNGEDLKVKGLMGNLSQIRANEFGSDKAPSNLEAKPFIMPKENSSEVIQSGEKVRKESSVRTQKTNVKSSLKQCDINVNDVEYCEVKYLSTCDQNETQFKCEKCDQYFSMMPDLVEHTKSAHEAITYICCFCDTVFTKQRHLSRHIRESHGGLGYECNLCTHIFNRDEDLVNHKNISHKMALGKRS